MLSGGINITSGADLKSDTYKVPGNYYCRTGSIARTLINCPFNMAFIMKVDYSNGIGYPRQTFTPYVPGKIITRTFDADSGSWTDDTAYITNSDLTVTGEYVISSGVLKTAVYNKNNQYYLGVFDDNGWLCDIDLLRHR